MLPLQKLPRRKVKGWIYEKIPFSFSLIIRGWNKHNLFLIVNWNILLKLTLQNHKTIDNSHKPGRQVTAFLSLYNIAQWLVMSFEIQKVSSLN